MPFYKLDPAQPPLRFPLGRLTVADQVVVWCQACNRRSTIAPSTLLAKALPDDELEALLERTLRCRECGGRGSWRERGVLAWFVERARAPER